jgi:hypothetical protein
MMPFHGSKIQDEANDRDSTRQVANGRDLSRFTMLAEEALTEFQRAGLPIKLRTVQRYCWRGKLDCIKIDPDTREPTDGGSGVYLIDPDSIPSRIEQLLDRKEFGGTTGRDSDPAVRDISRQDATGHDGSRTDSTRRDTTGHGGQVESGQLKVLEDELEDTKDKLQDAMTQAAGHRAVAIQIRKDRDEAYRQLRLTDRAVGILQDRVLRLGGDPTYPQLAAPGAEDESDRSEHRAGDNSTADDQAPAL